MKLEIENLSVAYDTGAVLHGLSLQMEEGEFLSILGPSGCGKTTLMKAIAGIVPVRGGRIFLDGQEITNLPIHKRGTVVVFQDMRLFPHKTVAENVAFPLKMQGVAKGERLRRARELLQTVQMGGFANRRPSELSGGQQQRVALARALAAKASAAGRGLLRTGRKSPGGDAQSGAAIKRRISNDGDSGDP